MNLGPPPPTSIEHVEQMDGSRPGFLRLERWKLRNTRADGQRSDSYVYDFVDRASLDAVAMLLEAGGEGGPFVCLRSALRPPLEFRGPHVLPSETLTNTLWEIPAGLVEPDERGDAGLLRCAARETLEEVGCTLSPEAFRPLGPSVFLSPGVMAEKLHFFHAVVDPLGCAEPSHDGSAVEEGAQVVFVPVREALAAVRDGRICDVKTETGIRRLAEKHGLV